MSDEIKPQYGFQLCSADDPARTHFWHRHEYDEWVAVNQNREPAFKPIAWRKPIPAPDWKPWAESEWELVPDDSDFVPENGAAMFFADKRWLTLSNDGFTVRYWAKESCIAKVSSAFARRKASPRTDGWVYFKDRKPTEIDLPMVATKTDGRVTIFSNKQNWQSWMDWKPGTLWCAWKSIGPLPALEKSEAEKLADEYVESRNIRNSGYETAVHRGFLAGYEAGRKG